MSDLSAALMVAIRVHAGQVDKRGKPYLLHVMRVVELVQRSAQVAAALHDVIEDGGEEGRRLVATLDLDEIDSMAVRLLSRQEGCSYEAYIASINARPANDIAREVKIADLCDNLERIPERPDGRLPLRLQVEWDAEWGPLKRRYEKALERLAGVQS